MSDPFASNPSETPSSDLRNAESRVTLRFERFASFVEEYSSNISLGGVFIKTHKARPVGTDIHFEFKLVDGFRLLHGQGQVVWVRLKDGGESAPAGMGVRFTAIDDSGRQLVLKLLEEQVKSGGAPFEVETVPADADSAPPSAGAADSLALPDLSEEPTLIGHVPAVELPDSEAPVVANAGGPGFDAPWGSDLPSIPNDLLDEENDPEVEKAVRSIRPLEAKPAEAAGAPEAAAPAPAVPEPAAEAPFPAPAEAAPVSPMPEPEPVSPTPVEPSIPTVTVSSVFGDAGESPAPQPVEEDAPFEPSFAPDVDPAPTDAPMAPSFDEVAPSASEAPIFELETAPPPQQLDLLGEEDATLIKSSDDADFAQEELVFEPPLEDDLAFEPGPQAAAASTVEESAAEPAFEVEPAAGDPSLEASDFTFVSADDEAAEPSESAASWITSAAPLADDPAASFEAPVEAGLDPEPSFEPAFEPPVSADLAEPAAVLGPEDEAPPVFELPADEAPAAFEAPPDSPTFGGEEAAFAAQEAPAFAAPEAPAFELPAAEPAADEASFGDLDAAPVGGDAFEIPAPDALASAPDAFAPAPAPAGYDQDAPSELPAAAVEPMAPEQSLPIAEEPAVGPFSAGADSMDAAAPPPAFGEALPPDEGQPAGAPAPAAFEADAAAASFDMPADVASFASQEPPAAAPAPGMPHTGLFAQPEGDAALEATEEWPTTEGEDEDWMKPAEPTRRWLPLVAAVLVVGVLASAYFFRQPLAQLVGLGSPAGEAVAQAPSGRAPGAAARPPAGQPEPPIQAPDPSTTPGDAGLGGDGAATAATSTPAADSEPASTPQGTNEGASGADGADASPGTSNQDGTAAAEPTPSPPPATSAPPPPPRGAPPAIERPASRGSTGRGAGKVLDVQWQRQSTGTRVTIQFDGSVDAARFRHDPLAWANDRERVIFSGVENFRLGQIDVGSPELQRIRIGHHPGQELHFVFDLASGEASLVDLRPSGDRLEILIQRR